MTGGVSTGSRGPQEEMERLWELFARTGFPCALRALRELERQQEALPTASRPAAA